jgi:hypothetical protein
VVAGLGVDRVLGTDGPALEGQIGAGIETGACGGVVVVEAVERAAPDAAPAGLTGQPGAGIEDP